MVIDKILGLLKTEFAIKSGIALFMSPKCYFMDDEDPKSCDGVKKALKGIHNATEVTKEEFLSALHQNKVIMKKQIRLRKDLKKSKFCTIEETKKAVNSVYYKMKVSEDFITCSPHF